MELGKTMKVDLGSVPGASRFASRVRTLLVEENPTLLAFLLLVLVGFSVYARALRYVPTDIDDVLILSSVAQVQNPAAFLAQDIGLGKNEYRPLHAFSVWLLYRISDINVTSQQMLNILLHVVNACLLLLILRGIGTQGMLLFIVPAVFLLSVYSYSPATWISDRPALLVTAWLLLALKHLINAYRESRPASLPYLLLLSVLSLLSKESGLVVPLSVAIVVMIQGRKSERYRTGLSLVALAVAYLGFRYMLFGSEATAYHESGVILGAMRYSDRMDLPVLLQYYALVENVLKNLVAPFAPVFDNKGGLFVGSPAIAWLPTVMATIALGVSAFGRGFSKEQWMMIIVILTNSVVHYAVFRYRTQYISEFAFCIFLASSVRISLPGNWQTLVKLMGVVVVFGSVFTLHYQIENGWERRVSLLSKENFGITDDRFASRVDKGVMERIRARYGPKE